MHVYERFELQLQVEVFMGVPRDPVAFATSLLGHAPAPGTAAVRLSRAATRTIAWGGSSPRLSKLINFHRYDTVYR